MFHLSKKIIVLFILISFLSILFFSLSFMIHDSNRSMSSNCLFSFSGTSSCPQNILTAAMHHIFAYHSFFNIPVDYGLIILIISLFISAFIILKYYINLFLSKHFVFLFNLVSVSLYDEKIRHWLSLLENSPSVS